MAWDGADFFDATCLRHSKSTGTSWARTDERIRRCYALDVSFCHHMARPLYQRSYRKCVLFSIVGFLGSQPPGVA